MLGGKEGVNMERSGNLLVLEVNKPYRASHIKYYFSNTFPQPLFPNADYVGVEILPFKGEGEVIIEINQGVATVTKNTVPDSVMLKLKEYRSSRLTIDIDTPYIPLDVLRKVYSISSTPHFVKTRSGYHIIIPLQKAMTFDEKIKVRRELGDDEERIKYDLELAKLNLHGLTEILFDYKWWSGETRFHKWRHVHIEEVSKLGKLPFKLPKMEVLHGLVKIDGNKVILEGFKVKDAERIFISIQDNLWEYAIRNEKEEKETLEERLFSMVEQVYGVSFAMKLKMEIRMGFIDIISDGETLILYLKGDSQKLAGRLIGKQGANVKALSSKLGLKVKILTEKEVKPPERNEHEELRRRLENVLKTLVH